MASKETRPQLQADTAVRVQVHTKIQQVLFQETHHVQDAVQTNIKENDGHGQAPAPVQLLCPIGHVSTFKSA